jgi:hypothetical protein
MCVSGTLIFMAWLLTHVSACLTFAKGLIKHLTEHFWALAVGQDLCSHFSPSSVHPSIQRASGHWGPFHPRAGDWGGGVDRHGRDGES